MEKVKEQLTVKDRQLQVASASAAAAALVPVAIASSSAASGTPAPAASDSSMLSPLVQKGAGYARALSEGIMLGFGGAVATPPPGSRPSDDGCVKPLALPNGSPC